MLNPDKKMRATLLKEKDKLKVGRYIDTYNRNIRTDGLCCAIHAGVSFRNQSFVVVKKWKK